MLAHGQGQSWALTIKALAIKTLGARLRDLLLQPWGRCQAMTADRGSGAVRVSNHETTPINDQLMAMAFIAAAVVSGFSVESGTARNDATMPCALRTSPSSARAPRVPGARARQHRGQTEWILFAAPPWAAWPV